MHIPHQPRVRMMVAFLALVLAATRLLGVDPKPQHHEARHEIDRLEEAWRTAVLHADVTALSSLLADDYMGITSSGTLQTKDELLAAFRSGKVHFTVLDLSDRKIRFYGATALVNCRAEVEGTNSEGTVSGSYRYTRVYIRQPGGAWKIVSFEVNHIRSPGENK